MKVINTKTIGEKILLLEPGESPTDIPIKFRDLIVYTTNELKVIKDRSITGDELLMLHSIKKEFRGSEIRKGFGNKNYAMDVKAGHPTYRKNNG